MISINMFYIILNMLLYDSVNHLNVFQIKIPLHVNILVNILFVQNF